MCVPEDSHLPQFRRPPPRLWLHDVLEAFDSSHLRRNSEFVGRSISQNLFYPAIHLVVDLQAFRLSSSPPAALTTREFIDSSTTTMTDDHDKPTELHCRAQAPLISPPLTPLARVFSPHNKRICRRLHADDDTGTAESLRFCRS